VTAARTGRSRSDGLVLAVDGGNTKTDLALLEASGALLSLVRGDGSSAHHLGVEGSIAVLAGLLESAIARAGLGSLDRPLAATAQILVAGADLPEERSALRAEIERLGWSDRLVIDNDMPALLRAGTSRGWGIGVVCGGGINCLGVAPDGSEVRFLSFGPLSGDWGGGADIGLAALAAAARSADGRGPRTILERAVPTQFGLADALELSRALHLRQIPAARLGELAAVVLAAADEDPVAQGIVRRLGDEVVAFASAAIRRLGLVEADPDVVLGGRVLRSVPTSLVDSIARGVQQTAPDARVILAPSEPIVGAALLALAALAPDADASARARAELDAAVAGVRFEPPATAYPPAIARALPRSAAR
jgi:N-acetylglucosamine kinase-like BadF-type ATPase